MVTDVTFAFGSLMGPVVETPKTDSAEFKYGSIYGPVIAVEISSGVTVNLGVLEAVGTLNTPTLTPGSVTTSLGVLEAEGELLDPTLTPGSVTVSPGVLEAEAALFDLSLTPGAVTVSPGVLEAVAELLDVGLSSGAGTVDLGVLEAVAELLDPTLTPGAVTITPGVLEAVAELLDLTVTPGGVQVSLGVLEAEAELLTPTLTPGAVTIDLDVLEAVAELLDIDFAGLVTGLLSIPMAKLRDLLAETSEFQAYVGAGDAAAAAAHIHIGGIASPTRPFVVVSIEQFEARRYAGGARSWFLLRGSLRAMWEADVAAEDQDGHADAETAFLGGIDTILRAALDLAGSDDHISLESFALAEDPSRADEDEADDYYQAVTVAQWGQG